nr:MAG TPA: hypothetical protein [Caudoviricetes sp.]
MLRYQVVCKFKCHGESEMVVRQSYKTLEKAMSIARPKVTYEYMEYKTVEVIDKETKEVLYKANCPRA